MNTFRGLVLGAIAGTIVGALKSDDILNLAHKGTKKVVTLKKNYSK